MKLTGHVSLFHSNFSTPLTHQHHKTLPLLLLASFTSPFQFALFSNILPSSHLSKDLISQCKSSHSLTLTLFSLSTLPFFIFYFPFLFLFTSIYIYLFYPYQCKSSVFYPYQHQSELQVKFCGLFDSKSLTNLPLRFLIILQLCKNRLYK